jgi:hypothetical protein
LRQFVHVLPSRAEPVPKYSTSPGSHNSRRTKRRVAIPSDVPDLRVFEDGGVEVDDFFGVSVTPEKGVIPFMEMGSCMLDARKISLTYAGGLRKSITSVSRAVREDFVQAG